MTGRSKFLLAAMLAFGLGSFTDSRGQYPPQYIPPTPVPETEEPEFADPRIPRQLPDNRRPEILTPQGTPGILAGTGSISPPANDPPTPSVSIHVSAPTRVAIGSPLVYTITLENRSQAPRTPCPGNESALREFAIQQGRSHAG